MPTPSKRQFYNDNIARSLGYLPILPVVDAAAGGPSDLGTVTMAGTATCAASLVVTRTLAGTFAGTGTATVSLRVIRSLVVAAAGTATVTADVDSRTTLVGVTIAGTGTMAASLRVLRTLGVTSNGVGTMSAAMAAGGAVDLGVATFAGTATATADLRVLRTLPSTFSGTATATADIRLLRGLSPTFDGVGSMLVTVDATPPPPPIRVDGAGSDLLAELFSLRSQLRQRIEAHDYAGIRGVVPSRHNVYPPGTVDAGEPNIYVEAVSNMEKVYSDTLAREEAERSERELNLELGRRLRRLNPPPRTPPQPQPNRDRERILKNIEERMNVQKEATNKAKMAWVRSFKNRG